LDIAVHPVVEHDDETAEMPGYFKVQIQDFAIGTFDLRAVIAFGGIILFVLGNRGRHFWLWSISLRAQKFN